MKYYFYSNNQTQGFTGDPLLALYFHFHRSAFSKCHKFAENLDFAFSRCNFALVSLLKHAPFWRTTIPKAFRYHTEGTQNAWLRESTPLFALHSVFDRSPFILRSRSVHPPFALRSSSVRAPFALRSSSVHPPFNLRSSSVRAPFILRSTSVRAPFELRSSSVQPPFELRSFSVRSSIVLRSSSVHPPFILRSGIEERSKNDRKTKGESSEAKRRYIETLMGNQGKGNPNKKTPQIPHKPHAPDSQKKTLKKLSTRKTLKINTLSKIAKIFFKKTS